MKVYYTKLRLVLTVLFVAMTMGVFAQSTCPALKTYTQGGWGAAPSGNNVGTFLDRNFAANFPAPTYLTIGCTNKLQLTSAAAVRAFLPNGTTPYVLPAGTKVNPTKSNFSNVLAGQLVALALNLRFDNNIASFAPATVNLKNQIIATGPFKGKTVQFLFDNANLIIGGCTGYFPASLSDYNNAIDMVNRNNDNGGINLLSYLACPVRVTCTTTNNLCNGAAAGTMTVTASSGVAPYTYTWTVPSGYAAIGNVASATGLKAGTYSVSVRDAVGQVASTSCTVTEPSAIVLTANGTNPLCSTGSGTITFGATGGTGAISYTVNGAAATSPYTAAASGTYTIVATDANNCTKSTTVTIAIPTPVVATDAHTDVLCYGLSTGSVTLTFSGGTPGYSVDFNGSGAIAQTSPKTYSDLAAGSYNWTVTDANGCAVSGSETVDQPSAAVSVSVSVTPDSDCDDNVCDGSALATAGGGTGAYTYSWVYWTVGGSFATGTQIGGNSSSVNNLCGSYIIGVEVTDANGCKARFEGLDIVTCIPHECAPLKTFTQGGWGAVPNGGNPGVYLHANFDAAFPSGITLGCTNTIAWTSAQAITDWLPSGTTPDVLPAGNIVNPTSDYNNVLVAQLLAASLSVGFDAYDANFSANDGSLGGRYFADGPFAGQTVNTVIAWASDAIGGCDDHGHTLVEYNEALTNVNENYDNGTVDNGHLTCTAPAAKGFVAADAINAKVFPNPAATEANVTFDGKIGQIATIALYDLSGRMLMTQKMATKNGLNQFRLNVSRLVNQTYVVKVIAGNRATTSMIVVQH